MACKRYGDLKPEELSRQESAMSGARVPPSLLDAVSAFASNKPPGNNEWFVWKDEHSYDYNVIATVVRRIA